MKKISLVMVLFLFSNIASAKVGTRNLEEEVKFRQICVDNYEVPAAADGTAGIAGVLYSPSIDAVSSVARSAAIGTMQTPAKLTVATYDASANGTVVCTTVTIEGEDQFGTPIVEAISVSETAAQTTNVFGTVSAVTAAGCSGGATGDELMIAQSLILGLTLKVTNDAQVISACIKDASDSSNLKCAARDDGTSVDIDSAVSVSAHTIDFTKAMFGVGSKVAAADGDGICFMVRP